MFRAAAPGPFDEAVGKATDENATSEDWAAILEVCDRVSGDAVNGPKDAVQSLIRRLAHRNANVQLYTLELANALSQNCGTPLHRELASRAFTDALLKLANDRNTHNLVRLKILERMKAWSDMFRSNTDLGIMQDAYSRLQQSQPQLQLAAPPSAPQKNSLTELDRQREEEDLQRALKLSLEDETGKGAPAAAAASGAAPSGAAGPLGSAYAPGQAGSSSSAYGATPGGAAATAEAAPGPTPQGTTAATVSRVRALFDFAASERDELDFKKGDIIAVLESVYRDWWRGSLKGRTGIFPLNYVEILADPTPEELQREAQMEAEVFAEIKNVEKLLTLLSASNTVPRDEDTDEISKLYHQTLAIRPKLIKLIEKYSQKKDDFTQLNEKFIKARRDYEALLESSMSHPPQPNYQQYAMPPQQQMPQQGYARPGGPGGPGGPAPVHAGYQTPGPAQQPDRYYTPGPQRQDQQSYPHSPPPNSNRVKPGNPSAFYLSNTDLPATQQPQYPQQQPQRRQQQPQQQRYQTPQPHPGQGTRISSGGAPVPNGVKKQTSPLHTGVSAGVNGPNSSNGVNNQTYLPYHPHQSAVSSPGAGYPNHPQELSTSAYDTPIAQQQQQQQQFQPSAPQQAPPQAPQQAPPQPSQQPPQPQQQQPQQPPSGSYSGAGYSSHADEYAEPSAPSAAYPGYAGLASAVPAPLHPAPLVPAQAQSHSHSHSQSQSQPHPQPPISSASPPPAALSIGGGAYDARQTLPSRGSGSGPSASAPVSNVSSPSPPVQQQQQYLPYVPPSDSASQQADDYYRQTGRVGL